MAAFADADWANDFESSRSISGFVVTVGRGAVMWSSRIQRCVALSSSEAEYYSLSECTQAVQFCRSILQDIADTSPPLAKFIDLSAPSTIHEDNAGAIALTQSLSPGRTKHLLVTVGLVDGRA